jgi:DNA processing protein
VPQAREWTRLDPEHPHWPVGWGDLHDGPASVLITGDPAALARPCVAIVGTRRATPRGLAVARGLAHDLAARGWVIASGLALGIDGEAHRGALAAGAPTVAVMATGPERTYPVEHGDLRRRIEDGGGCAVTEGEPDATIGRWLFPRRNRLIAALARAVIVVEAPAHSGALTTAQLAVDLGREVMAVPGPVDRAESRGCHELIRAGATLVWHADQVEEVLGPADPALPRAAAPAGPPLPAAGSAARWIYDRLDLEGIDHGALAATWPGTREIWVEGLLALEMAGLIRRLPGGRLARTIWRP